MGVVITRGQTLWDKNRDNGDDIGGNTGGIGACSLANIGH